MQALGASLPQFLLDGVINASRTYIFLEIIQTDNRFICTRFYPENHLPCDRFVFPSVDTFFPYLSFLTFSSSLLLYPVCMSLL